jgi:hypothetical protein
MLGIVAASGAHCNTMPRVGHREDGAMTDYEARGRAIRESAKALVLDYMRAHPECQPGREGIRLSPLFRACGFDWGEYRNATSSNQQYWIVALVRARSGEQG